MVAIVDDVFRDVGEIPLVFAVQSELECPTLPTGYNLPVTPHNLHPGLPTDHLNLYRLIGIILDHKLLLPHTLHKHRPEINNRLTDHNHLQLRYGQLPINLTFLLFVTRAEMVAFGRESLCLVVFECVVEVEGEGRG